MKIKLSIQQKERKKKSVIVGIGENVN